MTEQHRSRAGGLIKQQLRNVPPQTRLALYVLAGGRCEFDGCNRYLLEHHLTKAEGNFAQMGHICAFSCGGPRSGQPGDGTSVHALSNLMLLCPECHKLVDDHPEKYSVALLREYKKAHEDRIFMLTDTKPDRHTAAFVFQAEIGGRAVSVSLAQMQEAVVPRYLSPRDVVRVDLTDIPDSISGHFWRTGAEAIRSKAQLLSKQVFETGPARHVSVFSLGPIPLLVFLGTCLSDKVPVSLYQRHRDTQSWKWREQGEVASYEYRTLQHGTDPASVALVVSLSGRIRQEDIPAEIDDRFTVCEITLSGVEPTPCFLELHGSLLAFQNVFQRTIRDLVASHQGLEQIHLLPAVPAPVAVAIGRDLMPKRDPALLVYDYDKRAGGFVQTLEVNSSERE